MNRKLPPNRDSAERFWLTMVNGKERQQWQKHHWALGMEWYLRWLATFESEEAIPKSLEERARMAVELMVVAAVATAEGGVSWHRCGCSAASTR